MNKQQTFLISELHRFYKEHDRNPKQIDLLINNKGNYPTHNEYRNAFNLSFSEILKLAGLHQNISTKEIEINCKVCGKKTITTRTDRNICDNKKCRYIRDMLLKSKYNMEKHPFSIFHFVSEDDLKTYYSNMYDNRKEINDIRMV